MFASFLKHKGITVEVFLTRCCSFFPYRNNLTVLDVVSVQGQGARGELMINGKRPSGESVLLFELKQKHLEDCTSMCAL